MSQLPTTNNHPKLSVWLNDNKLSKYESTLNESGIETFEDLLSLLSESQMREVGTNAKMLPLDKYRFIKAVVSAKQKFSKFSESQIREYFKTFDTDGDGMVTAKELREGLAKIGQKISEEQANLMIKNVDEDGNGELDFEEFTKIFNIECSKVNYSEEELRAFFKSFDSDGDGTVSAKELKEGLIKLGRTNVSDEEINNLLKEVDEDGNGILDFEEFQLLMNNQLIYTEEEIKRLFKSFDIDGDGMVTPKELKEGLIKIGRKNITEERINKMIKNIDEDGNGELDYGEFRKLFS